MPSHGIKQGAVQGVGYPHGRFPITQAEALRDFGETFNSIWPYQVAGNPVSVPNGAVILDVVPALNLQALNTSAIPITFDNSVFANRGVMQFVDGAILQRTISLPTNSFNALAGVNMVHCGLIRMGAIPAASERGFFGKFDAGGFAPFWRCTYLSPQGGVRIQTRDTANVIFLAQSLLDHSNKWIYNLTSIDRVGDLLSVTTPLAQASVSIVGALDFNNGVGTYQQMSGGATLPGNFGPIWTAMMFQSRTLAQLTALGRLFWRGGIPIPGAL